MRCFIVVGAALFSVACSQSAPDEQAASGLRGRYLGVGVYSAGQLWSRMAVKASAAPGAATTADDEHVIVVADSRTGELRECGDYTGLCVSLNPWTKAITSTQTAPVTLTKHLADVAREEQAAARTTAKP